MTASTVSRRRAGRRTERGSGLLGSVIGVGIVTALVALSANVALGLWTRSTIESISYDAARSVATAPYSADPRTAEQRATDRALSLMGSVGRRVELRFEHDSATSDVVVLRVRAPGVSLLPRMVDGGPVVGALDRRIVIRREGAR